MAPRRKCSKEEVVNAAYEIMLESGIENVAARNVAEKLNTSTGPIFTYFESMDQLKEAVYQRAKKRCLEYLYGSLDYFPAFKEFGLRVLQIARERSHEYELVFLLKGYKGDICGFFNADLFGIFDLMVMKLMETFPVFERDARSIVKDMTIYVAGIASKIIADSETMTDEEINETLSRVCIALVISCKLQNGSFNEGQAKIMLSKMMETPVIAPKREQA